MINYRQENFTKQFNCINKLKISNLKVDLTHVTLINKVLSYQLNGNYCYEPYCDMAEALFISERKLYTIINDLKKVGILVVETKRLGPKRGSLTNLSINLDKLDEHLVDKPNLLPANEPQKQLSVANDIQLPEEKESPLQRLEIEDAIITSFTNNYGQTMVINEDNLKCFNIVVNNEPFFNELKEEKNNQVLNEILHMLQKEDLINNK